MQDDGIDYDAEFLRLVDPEPEFVTRNDDTILPFNRLFYRQDSDIISSDDADSTSGDTQAAGIRIGELIPIFYITKMRLKQGAIK